ncbi:FAD-dependent monooxygenase [Streptomyces calvus]
MPQRAATVVGGGIGGLAAALALHRRGWHVEVLERAPEFTEIGAGISLWPNALHALKTLGLADTVRALGAVESGGGVRDRRGRRLSRTDNAELERRFGHPLVVLHRADLLRALAGALPADSLLPDSEVTAVHDDGGQPVVVRRGHTSRPGLVVGADGLRSAVRRSLWPDAPGPRYAGYTAWRMVTDPLAAPPAEGAVIWGAASGSAAPRCPADACTASPPPRCRRAHPATAPNTPNCCAGSGPGPIPCPACSPRSPRTRCSGTTCTTCRRCPPSSAAGSRCWATRPTP